MDIKMNLEKNLTDKAIIDRRNDQRRAESDRRTTFRFLMEKPNRRISSDRRANQDVWSEQIALRASN